MGTNSLLSKIEAIRELQNKKLIGQEHLTDALLISLICEGHLLLEGLPGLAKTRAIKSFSESVSAEFGRIQFTPDMLPSDITGNDVYDPATLSFKFVEGPVFANIILADEINRAPAKVQSALLEAMQEKQVTINGKTYLLPSPFLVMATQNPRDQDGTFVLPEAQKDRFLMNVILAYPTETDELEIMRLVRAEESADRVKVSDCALLSPEDVSLIQKEVGNVYVSDIVERYIVRLIQSTRQDSDIFNSDSSLKGVIAYGAGPRATLALDKCARAVAWMAGRDYVTGDDVKKIAKDVLRHRIKLSLKAMHSGLTPDKVLDQLLLTVGV